MIQILHTLPRVLDSTSNEKAKVVALLQVKTKLTSRQLGAPSPLLSTGEMPTKSWYIQHSATSNGSRQHIRCRAREDMIAQQTDQSTCFAEITITVIIFRAGLKFIKAVTSVHLKFWIKTLENGGFLRHHAGAARSAYKMGNYCVQAPSPGGSGLAHSAPSVFHSVVAEQTSLGCGKHRIQSVKYLGLLGEIHPDTAKTGHKAECR